ncbi:hypothetical protein AOLI_G00290810 [Acnodon oligacanthus]
MHNVLPLVLLFLVAEEQHSSDRTTGENRDGVKRLCKERWGFARFCRVVLWATLEPEIRLHCAGSPPAPEASPSSDRFGNGDEGRWWGEDRGLFTGLTGGASPFSLLLSAGSPQRTMRSPCTRSPTAIQPVNSTSSPGSSSTTASRDGIPHNFLTPVQSALGIAADQLRTAGRLLTKRPSMGFCMTF